MDLKYFKNVYFYKFIHRLPECLTVCIRVCFARLNPQVDLATELDVLSLPFMKRFIESTAHLVLYKFSKDLVKGSRDTGGTQFSFHYAWIMYKLTMFSVMHIYVNFIDL